MKSPLTLAALSLSALTLASAGLFLGGAGSATTSASMNATADGPYNIDLDHSSVVFAIQHNKVNDVYGRFNAFSGSFLIDPASPDKSTLSVAIDADSIDTNNAGRDKHLKTPDFFSTKEFPKATFTSSKFTKTGDNQFDVTGELDLHGVKKTITAKVDYRGEGQGRGGPVSGLVATFSLPRADFGITKYAESLGNNVSITVSLQGAR